MNTLAPNVDLLILSALLVLAYALIGLGGRVRRRPAQRANATRSNARFGRLVVMSGPLQGESFTIRSSELKIGRDPVACQMVLSEPTVSRQHALLIAADTQREFILRNLSRTNPTIVNDRAVQETRLRPGDRIRIGNSVIGYEDGS